MTRIRTAIVDGIITRNPYDIAASNQRQSDFYQGWEDAEDGRAPRKQENDDYMRGYCANPRAFRWPK
jgi:DNA modification methylase